MENLGARRARIALPSARLAAGTPSTRIPSPQQHGPLPLPRGDRLPVQPVLSPVGNAALQDMAETKSALKKSASAARTAAASAAGPRRAAVVEGAKAARPASPRPGSPRPGSPPRLQKERPAAQKESPTKANRDGDARETIRAIAKERDAALAANEALEQVREAHLERLVAMEDLVAEMRVEAAPPGASGPGGGARAHTSAVPPGPWGRRVVPPGCGARRPHATAGSAGGERGGAGEAAQVAAGAGPGRGAPGRRRLGAAVPLAARHAPLVRARPLPRPPCRHLAAPPSPPSSPCPDLVPEGSSDARGRRSRTRDRP